MKTLHLHLSRAQAHKLEKGGTLQMKNEDLMHGHPDKVEGEIQITDKEHKRLLRNMENGKGHRFDLIGGKINWGNIARQSLPYISDAVECMGDGINMKQIARILKPAAKSGLKMAVPLALTAIGTEVTGNPAGGVALSRALTPMINNKINGLGFAKGDHGEKAHAHCKMLRSKLKNQSVLVKGSK